MRRTSYVAASLALAGGILVTQAWGCVFSRAHDCEGNLECSDTAATSTGGDGGTPAACVPSSNKQPVEDTCGIFVSSSKGQDGNQGTKGAPLQTLEQAIDKAKGRPVYACAEAFAGSVTLASRSAIYGGLDCAKDWAYVGDTTKSALTGEADKIALTLASSANEAVVEDFTIQAANAAAAGGSSIAVLADQVTARLTRCDLVAGDGAAGAKGEDAPSTAPPAGAAGGKGGDACSGAKVNGADQVTNTCGTEVSVSGSGGDGTLTNGTDGSSGAPLVAGKGAGGKGETSVGWDCSADGVNGGAGIGAAGQPGTEGAGASMTDLGTLTSSGFTGAAGSDGEPGKIGQGGGGGGGAKGGTAECNGKAGTGGASGGSGGAGGCGGAGGKGGKGGGASIALVSLQASLTLEQVTLKAGSGGEGGVGGDRQAGGDPGVGGTGGAKVSGLNAGCDGGKGGPGGDGGPGGGGRGGHAIGLAYTGTMPTLDMKQITPGRAGTGGPGGNGNVKTNAGADGSAEPIQAFPSAEQRQRRAAEVPHSSPGLPKVRP